MIHIKTLSINVTVIFSMVALNPSLSNAEPVKELSTIEWEKSFGSEEYSYQNTSLALLPQNQGLIIGGIYSSAEKGIRQKNVEGIWIWKIDNEGKKVADIRLQSVKDKDVRFVNIEALSVGSDGNVQFIGRTNTGQTILTKIDVNGDILMSRKMENRVHVSKIISMLDNKFLLIGHQSLDSLLIKIDADGVKFWDKVIDRGKQDFFVDGITTDDGGLMLVENSGKIEQFFTGPSNIWVTKYNAGGEKKHETMLSGRYGSISGGKNGSYVMLYDESDSMSQDIRVQAFGKDLKRLWNLKIAATKFGLERFKIIGLNSGDYVAVGPINGKPWISYIDSSGVKKWDFYGQSMEFASGFDFTSNGKDCFIISTIIVLDNKIKYRKKVRTIKFTPTR